MLLTRRLRRFLLFVFVLSFCFFALGGQIGEAALSYRVATGDTLWLIAQRHNVTVAQLMAANGLSSLTIYPGQLLSIPVKIHTVRPGDTMWLIAQRYGIGLPALLAANPGVSPASIYPGQKINLPDSNSSSLPSREGRDYSQQDIDLLARLVYAEAAGEPYAGQVAVAASVLNRIKSPLYPNTISSVIYQVSYGYYQYSPVLDGRINLPANKTAYQAVYDALSGWDPSNGALGFFNPLKTSNQWVRQQTVTAIIGNHVFFR